MLLPDGLPLAVNRQDPRPLAIQLADGLRAAAASGALRKGDRLPSTRALATTLAVSRTVTAAAYLGVEVCESHAVPVPGTALRDVTAPDNPDLCNCDPVPKLRSVEILPFPPPKSD